MAYRSSLCEVCRLRPRTGTLFCDLCRKDFDAHQRYGNFSTTDGLLLWATQRAWRFARAKVRAAALR